MEDHRDLIISWEDSIISSNNYFMDTVQSIRKIIFKEEGESSQKYRKVDKPYYLKHISDTKIKDISNEDQRLFYMQIEIFAYWKLMKKRFVDNAIISTCSGLVNKPINCILKISLLEATLCHTDNDLVKMLSPDVRIFREQNNLFSCIGRLQKAKDYLD